MKPTFFGTVAGGAIIPSWWEVSGITCVGAYQAKGADSLAASYTNLADAETPLVPGVAPTWDATDGWIFNGTTQYIDTTIVPANDQTWSFMVRYSAATTDQRWVVGVVDGGFGAYFGSTPLFFGSIQYASGGIQSTGTNTAAGVVGIAGNKAYHDGVAESGTISSAAGSWDGLAIGGLRLSGGTATSFYAGKIQAVALYSGTLNGTQVANLTIAMNAL